MISPPQIISPSHSSAPYLLRIFLQRPVSEDVVINYSTYDLVGLRREKKT